MGTDRRVVLSVVILSVLFFWGGLYLRPGEVVLACSPPPDGFPAYSAFDRANAAALVLEGTVIETVEANGLQVATVQIDQYLKGTGPQTVTISNFGQSSLCLTTVTVNEHWIFYVEGDAQTGLQAHYLTAHDAVDPVNADVLKQIDVAVGPKIYLPGLILRAR